MKEGKKEKGENEISERVKERKGDEKIKER